MKIDHLLKGQPFQTEYGIVGYSSVVLVRTDDKVILYDCGQRGCALQLKAALADLGLSCGDITDVVISHLHFDHVGNLPLFKGAMVHLTETEWQTALKNPDEWHSIPTRLYIEQEFEVNFVKEGDLIADAVKVLELPGHTMGLIGLKCGEDTLLCSDSCKNRYELWQDIPLMSVDSAKSKQTIERIRREARFIYPGHDRMLDMEHPIDREEIHFDLKYADGRIKHI